MTQRHVFPYDPAKVQSSFTFEQHKAEAIKHGWAWKPGMAGNTYYYPGEDHCPRYQYLNDDIAVGTSAGGKVTKAGWDNQANHEYGLGLYVQVTCGAMSAGGVFVPDGQKVWLGHLREIVIKTGEIVKAGQTVGDMGDTGNSSGRHTHWMVLEGNEPLPPLTLLGSTPPGPIVTPPPVIIPAGGTLENVAKPSNFPKVIPVRTTMLGAMNVRRSPVNGEVIGGVDPGTIIDVIGIEESVGGSLWMAILYQGMIGFVALWIKGEQFATF